IAALGHNLRRQRHLRLAGDELRERFANRRSAGDELAGRRHQRGLRLVERDEIVELGGVQRFGEQAVGIFWGFCWHGKLAETKLMRATGAVGVSKGSRSAAPAPGKARSPSGRRA